MISFGLQRVDMFPSFQGMGEFEAFVAEKPMLLGVSVSGYDAIPLLFHRSDANLEGELVAGMLAIVSQQIHFNEWRVEFEEQFAVEFSTNLVDIGINVGDKCELHHSFV